MTMDLLSTLLQSVKLTGAVFLDAEFKAPWCVSADGALLRQRLPEVEHFVNYHYLSGGACEVGIAGEAPRRVTAGQLIVFPHGDSHVMASSLRLAAVPMERLLTPAAPHTLPSLRYGGDGESTRVVCGFLACDPRLCRPLLSSLPRLLTVDLRGDPASDWIERSMRHSIAQGASGQAGATAVLARLSEALFVEALRRYALGQPAMQTGWLAAQRDPIVSKCLAMLHQEPARRWTVENLARDVGCSRTVLAQRFTDAMAEPPMQYLAHWRLALAAHALRHSPTVAIARVAQQVGYESQSAFNRAFKREHGATPAHWRRAGSASSMTTR
jgi:AraC-like DNA-binding protein